VNSARTVPPVLVALDFPSADTAWQCVAQLDPSLCGLKIGKELFTRAGPELVRRCVGQGYAVFLDLKFHDIPHTVAAAVTAAAELGVWMVNVHASGGESMLRAAREALGDRAQRPLLTAVTVLTSLADADLPAVGIQGSVQQQVQRLALLADRCGLDGVVCSAQEAASLKTLCRKGFVLVTPGIRLADNGVTGDDQQRVMTPRQAVAQGADYLVIGRPVTQAAHPRETLRRILEDISYS